MQNEIKKLIMEVVVNNAIKAAKAAVPFLNWPVLNQLFTSLVQWTASLIYDEMAQNYALIAIDLKTESQKQEYKEAVSKLETIISKPKEEQNAEEVEKARQEFKKRLQELIHLDRFTP